MAFHRTLNVVASSSSSSADKTGPKGDASKNKRPQHSRPVIKDLRKKFETPRNEIVKDNVNSLVKTARRDVHSISEIIADLDELRKNETERFKEGFNKTLDNIKSPVFSGLNNMTSWSKRKSYDEDEDDEDKHDDDDDFFANRHDHRS